MKLLKHLVLLVFVFLLITSCVVNRKQYLQSKDLSETRFNTYNDIFQKDTLTVDENTDLDWSQVDFLISSRIVITPPSEKDSIVRDRQVEIIDGEIHDNLDEDHVDAEETKKIILKKGEKLSFKDCIKEKSGSYVINLSYGSYVLKFTLNKYSKNYTLHSLKEGQGTITKGKDEAALRVVIKQTKNGK